MDTRQSADKRTSLKEAVSALKDGNSLSFGGMGGGVCVAAAHEIVRQGQKHLTIIGDSVVENADFLIGMGQVDRLEIAWCGEALAGLAYNFRRAAEEEFPHKIELEEYSNFAMGMRFLAGAMNLPYLPTRCLLGSDLVRYNPRIKVMDDPYGGKPVALVPAAEPDVAVIHVSRADKRGNAQILGFTSNAENIARAAKYTIVTCEELVTAEEIQKHPNLTSIPGYCVDAVVELPYGSHPWNMPYAYAYDLPFHMEMIDSFKTPEGFRAWMHTWCLTTGSHEGYLERLGRKRLDALKTMDRRFMKPAY